MTKRLRITGGALTVETLDPGAPDQGLPDGGAGIDNSLPPGFPPLGSTLPEPPPGVWPPLTPWAPIQPAPPGTPPGSIWPPVSPPDHISGQPLPPGTPPPSTKPPSKVFYIIAGIPGVGWRYVAVDPSLVAGAPLPPTPEPKED